MTREEMEKIVSEARAKGEIPNLYKANLSRADLSEAILYKANLCGANLSRANLSRADLSGADLSRAILSRAILSRANLSEAYLSKANLSRADLYGADLSRADLENVCYLLAPELLDSYYTQCLLLCEYCQNQDECYITWNNHKEKIFYHNNLFLHCKGSKIRTLCSKAIYD
jgi:Pentapeptide repeats (8 copies)